MFLVFFDSPNPLGVLRFTFGREAGPGDSSSLPASRAGQGELVGPTNLPGAVFAFEYCHQFTTTTSCGRRSPAPARRPQVRSQARYACLVMIHRRPRRTPGMIPCFSIE